MRSSRTKGLLTKLYQRLGYIIITIGIIMIVAVILNNSLRNLVTP